MDNQMLAASQPLRGRLYQRDDTRLKEHKILVLKTGIAGMEHHIKSDEERERAYNIEAGTELKLYREPDNKYDKWAIAVYITEDDKLGYISRFKNEVIARLMDTGKKFIAIADDYDEANEETADSARERKAPTENMFIPFSVYLVEES